MTTCRQTVPYLKAVRLATQNVLKVGEDDDGGDGYRDGDGDGGDEIDLEP